MQQNCAGDITSHYRQLSVARIMKLLRLQCRFEVLLAVRGHVAVWTFCHQSCRPLLINVTRFGGAASSAATASTASPTTASAGKRATEFASSLGRSACLCSYEQEPLLPQADVRNIEDYADQLYEARCRIGIGFVSSPSLRLHSFPGPHGEKGRRGETHPESLHRGTCKERWLLLA